MKFIKTALPLVLVFAVLVGASGSASAISTSLPDVTASDAIMRAWGTSNYSWSQNSSTHNMTLTAPYGDTSVLHGIMQGQALQNNTVMALHDSLLSELKKLTNNTSTGGGMIYILNQILNKIGTISTSNTILGELHDLSSYWGGSIATGSQKVTSIDNNLYYIKDILGSNSSNSRIRDIVNALSYNKLNGTDDYDLIYYIYYLGHSWNKNGAASSNDAYSAGSDWFSHILAYQSDIVSAINNKSYDFSSTVPADLKTGWGTSVSAFPSGYSSSYYEAMRSILRDIKSNSSLIQSSTSAISQNTHDYSSDLSGILTNTSSISQNVRDYSNDFTTINNNLSNLASESTVTQIGDYLSNGIYTVARYNLSGNPINFDAGTYSYISNFTVDITPTQSGSGTPSPDNPRPIISFDSFVVNAGEHHYNIPLNNSYYGGRYSDGQFLSYYGIISGLSSVPIKYNSTYDLFELSVPDVALIPQNVFGNLYCSESVTSSQNGQNGFTTWNWQHKILYWNKGQFSSVDEFRDYYIDAQIVYPLDSPIVVNTDSISFPTLSGSVELSSSVGTINASIETRSPYFQQNINLLSEQLTSSQSISSKLDFIKSATASLSDVLANKTDVVIRENSTTIINEYNNSFVSGSNGLSSSNISDYADTLGAVKSTLDSDFDFTSVVSVLTDLTNNGLSFWSEDVHSSLNPFGGVDDD